MNVAEIDAFKHGARVRKPGRIRLHGRSVMRY